MPEQSIQLDFFDALLQITHSPYSQDEIPKRVGRGISSGLISL
jgi:hypothetical protein